MNKCQRDKPQPVEQNSDCTRGSSVAGPGFDVGQTQVLPPSSAASHSNEMEGVGNMVPVGK